MKTNKMASWLSATHRTIVVAMGIVFLLSLSSCGNMKIITASGLGKKGEMKPIIAERMARKVAQKNGNAFYVRLYNSHYDYVFSFVNGITHNYIEIIQYDIYEPYVYKGDLRYHYRKHGKISLPYYHSISWVYDFNYNSYIENGGGWRDLDLMVHGWDDLLYYQCKDGVVIETKMELDNSGTPEEPSYENTDPENNDFYRQLVHDMLKFNLINDYTTQRLRIPTFNLVKEKN